MNENSFHGPLPDPSGDAGYALERMVLAITRSHGRR